METPLILKENNAILCLPVLVHDDHILWILILNIGHALSKTNVGIDQYGTNGYIIFSQTSISITFARGIANVASQALKIIILLLTQAVMPNSYLLGCSYMFLNIQQNKWPNKR